ncbi:MAG: ice-binding family protein [Desulfuromonadaceae bacterium]|nr:ice-binding family protein [Desulfuromonadaceae bacterium]MDD2848034.1 ice-binding family protein [Desulfuromonadaceae bacterium]MDD4131224.1 ice-binding family protein [Desulfuromonadaceae bacterium]
MNKYKVFSKMWFLVLLLVAFVAGCAENGAEVGPISKSLVSIAVTPATATIAIGGNQQYVVAATWSDQTFTYVTTSTSTVWSKVDVPTVSGDVVATLSPDGSSGGLATGTAAGTSTITAQYTFNGITKSATAGLIVSPTAALTIIPGASCSISSGATIPTVTSSNPTSGNQYVTTSTTGVANSGKSIIANFSLAMDQTTLDSATPGALSTFTLKESISGNNVPGTVLVDVATKKVATFTTSAALNADTNYTASITTAAKSATGVAISCAYEWDFKTIIPAQTGLPVINLGKAASFGVAATAGVVNVGTTTVNGDVVLDPLAECNAVTVGSAGLIGSCGGFAPTITGEVISPLYPDAGITSLAVVNDLRAAYIALSPANLPGATNIAAGPTLGAIAGSALVEGDNLFFPGVYQSGSSIMITGDLTLDASGNPDALFVFQSSSSIGTAATGVTDPHTRILLVNGAKASNVFWWVGSNAATLGTYTQFQGNIMSYSDITMETGATSCGRLFAGASTDGAFVFGNNIVSVPGNINAPASCK